MRVPARPSPGTCRTTSRHSRATRVRFGWTAWRVEGEIRTAARAKAGGVGLQAPEDLVVRRQAERLSEGIGSPSTIDRSASGGYELRIKAANLDVLNGELEHIGFDPEAD